MDTRSQIGDLYHELTGKGCTYAISIVLSDVKFSDSDDVHVYRVMTADSYASIRTIRLFMADQLLWSCDERI